MKTQLEQSVGGATMRHSSSSRQLGALYMLVVLVFTLSCLPTASLAGGPEAAARKGFEEWTKNTALSYRNASFETVSTAETSATIKITAEFQTTPGGPWVEQQATVQVFKRDNEWKPPTSFAFMPSPRTVKTQEAVRNVTATVEAARQQATASARQAVYDATATASAATQVARATEVVRFATATAEARATIAAVATQEAQVAQATRAAEATQQAMARATEAAQRTQFVNKPLTMQTVEGDSSEFRAYLKGVDFILVGVERADANSVLWRFYVWNHNAQDTFRLGPRRQAYIVSTDGKKYDALSWNEVQTVAGERKDFTIAFSAPATSGATYKLFLYTYMYSERSFHGVNIEWQPFEVTLQ